MAKNEILHGIYIFHSAISLLYYTTDVVFLVVYRGVDDRLYIPYAGGGVA